jgi:hypothetical protein
VPVGVNEITRAALKSIEPQFHAAGRPPVTPEIHLSEHEPVIEADPDHLRAALENLLLHCLDAMPSGGALAVRTQTKDALVQIEVSARSASLSAEDCRRLFVPSGAAPEGMTGLGLATAHAVVTDHGGRMSAESVPDGGITLHLEFAAATSGRIRPVQVDTAQPARQEPVRQIHSEPMPHTKVEIVPVETPAIAPPTQPIAAAKPSPSPLPVATAQAEPVPVTILSLDAPAAAEPATAAPEASSIPDNPNDSAHSRRGLTFTA